MVEEREAFAIEAGSQVGLGNVSLGFTGIGVLGSGLKKMLSVGCSGSWLRGLRFLEKGEKPTSKDERKLTTAKKPWVCPAETRLGVRFRVTSTLKPNTST